MIRDLRGTGQRWREENDMRDSVRYRIVIEMERESNESAVEGARVTLRSVRS